MSELIIAISILGVAIYFTCKFISENYIIILFFLAFIIIICVLYHQSPHIPPNSNKIEKINFNELQPIEYKDLIKSLKRSAFLDRSANLLLTLTPLIGIFIYLFYIAYHISPLFLLIIIAIVALAIAFKIIVAAKQRTKLEYNLTDTERTEYEKRIEAWTTLFQSRAVWEFFSESPVLNFKDNAGRKRIINRIKAKKSFKTPFHLKTNLKPLSVKMYDRTLTFLPDVVLIRINSTYGAIKYNDLQIRTWKEKYAETNGFPLDTTISEYTWQHVNKNGSQDLRYKDNRTVPVCLYGFVELTYGTSFKIILFCSNHEKICKF